MTTKTRYNGWTNYETWRIHLEIFDGTNPFKVFNYDRHEDVTAELCQDLAEQRIEQEAKGLAFGYAMLFLEDVNWHEIAEHLNAKNRI